MSRPLTPIRNDVQAELLARVRAGAPVTTVCQQPDMPSHVTLLAWRRKYPTFDEALTEARRVGLERRRWGFDEVRAEAFLTRLRGGERVRDIIGKRGATLSGPLYRRWMRTQAAFQEEVNRLIVDRHRRRPPPPAWAFDPAVADAIVRAVAEGLKVTRLGPATGFPSSTVVNRWRREQPEFDLGVRVAVRVWKRRASTRRGPGPDLLDEILDRVREGMSLNAVSQAPGMPSRGVLYGWRKANPQVGREIAQARWERGDALSDRIMELSETPAMAWANRREARRLMARLRRLEARREGSC